jgi:hypothetical protein
MTEAEWHRSNDPQAMLILVRGKESGRQLRLFCVACLQAIHSILAEQRIRELVTWIENSADRLVAPNWRGLNWATYYDLPCDHLRAGMRNAARAARSAYLLVDEYFRNYPDQKGKRAESQAVCDVSRFVLEALKGAADGNRALIARREKQRQANIARDIFFDPFRTANSYPAWLTSNVTSLAHAIYSDRAFDHMPILADALEDTGCDNADILDHCRQAGEHVRGCWVVDLLLGKE